MVLKFGMGQDYCNAKNRTNVSVTSAIISLSYRHIISNKKGLSHDYISMIADQ